MVSAGNRNNISEPVMNGEGLFITGYSLLPKGGISFRQKQLFFFQGMQRSLL
jgi:hypothetical protein